jgi:hypothetical protein
MNSGRIGCELAVVAVFCVLTVFLFPAIQGPYSAVNGPVTALQSARAALRLRTAIVQAACRMLGNLRILPEISSWMNRLQLELPSGALLDGPTILRC